jgi:hypothetical protein
MVEQSIAGSARSAPIQKYIACRHQALASVGSVYCSPSLRERQGF